MKYQAFFEVEIKHPYSASILEYVMIKPNISTTQLLQKSGLLYKQTEKGFKVFAPIKTETNTFLTFQADEKLVFSIFPTSSDFLGFTDFAVSDEDKVMLFSNESLSSGEGILFVSEAPSNGQFKGFPEVGQIKIKLENIGEGTDQTPTLFTAQFNAKSIIWKYYFITKEESDTLSVKHKDITFQQLSSETSDPVFNKLKTNFAPSGLFIKAFQSQEALDIQCFPRKDIQLKNENITMISHLPNPEFSDHGIKIIRIN